MTRRVDIFFYGLFMDPDLLRSKGLNPESVEVGTIHGFQLRIGTRAALVSEPAGVVCGIVMSVPLEEVDRLYSDPSVKAYQPEAVLVHLENGGTISALCYNLPDQPSQNESNPEYAAKLIAVAEKVRLPQQYIEDLKRSFTL